MFVNTRSIIGVKCALFMLFMTPSSRYIFVFKVNEVEEFRTSKVSRKDRLTSFDEEAAAKEREWEKNRLAVDREKHEACEWAFEEACERVEHEWAAIEKAAEEVKQRMMAEAHGKVSKAYVMNKSSKAISQKTAFELNCSELA
ncbi:hypothetical protein HanIR_Chr07g0329131 [Helianthus annuus]|nr:hypothetical protein HanIR_Chr07g0329131 [Helianthus annuus]